MANTSVLASAVVMASVLLGTVAFVIYARPWRGYTVATGGSVSRSDLDGTTSWLLGFLALSVFAALATVVTLRGDDILPLLLFVGGAVVAFLGAGVYVFGRSHGHPHSHAVGEAVITLGAVGLLAIAANLML